MAEGSESIFAQAKIEKSWLLWISLLAWLYASWLAIRWVVLSVKWKALPLASFPEVWVTPVNCLFSKPTALNISISSSRLGSIKESTEQHQKQQQQQQNVKEILDFFNSSVLRLKFIVGLTEKDCLKSLLIENIILLLWQFESCTERN